MNNERKKMEEQIRSLAKFPLENPNPILRLSKDGIVLEANPASEMLLRSWECRIGDPAPKSWRDWVSKVFESQSPRNMDLELAGKLYLFAFVPVKDFGYVNVYGRDVSDRMKMEEGLRFQAHLLASINDAIVASDEHFTLTLWNRAAEEIYGWKASEALGKKGPKLMRTEFIGVDQSEVFRTLNERGEWRGELFHYGKDGKQIRIESSSIMLRDQKGQIKGYLAVNRDITERKRIEQEIRAFSRFLEEMTSNLPDLVFIKDKDLKYVLVSDAACDFVGSPRQEILGRTAHDIYPRKFADNVEKTDREVLEKGTVVQVPEQSYISRDGKTQVLETKKAPLKDSQGNVTHVIAITRDVTNRKQMHETLQESEEKYRGLFENSSDAIAITNLDGRLTDANQAWLDLFGYSKNEIATIDVNNLYTSPEERRTFIQQIEKNGFAKNLEVKRRKKDGTIFDCLASASPFRDENGEIFAYQAMVIEISERKKMEENWKRSEERFRKIFQSSPNPYLITLPEGPILDVNDAWIRMSGYSREEAIGHSTIELDMVPDPKQRDQLVKELLQKRRLNSVEITRRTKSGELRYLLNTPELVELDGQTCILNMQVDITEYKKMEEELERHTEHLEELVKTRAGELARSEEKYHRLADNMSDIVFTTDLQGNYTYASPSVEQITQYPVAQLLSMNMKQLIAPEDYPKIIERLKMRIQGEQSLPPVEFEIVRADGTQISVEMHTSRILNDEGGLVGIQGIARDISQRKEAENKFGRIYNASLNAIYTSSLEGRWIDMNPAGISMFGYDSFDELKKVNIESLYVNRDNRKNFIQLASQGPVRGFETQFRRKDGTVFDAIVNSYSLKDGKDRITEFQGAITDITERKELERMRDQLTNTLLQDVARRKELEKMRDQFISAVTHELRTPLVSMTGYLDLALSEGSETMSEEVGSDLQVVKRNMDRLLNLVNDLLDVSRMQSGKLLLNLEPIDFKNVMEICKAEIQPLLDERKLSLRLEVPNKALPVQGDQVRLSQVMMNLLSNAAKFSSEGSEITLHVEDADETIKVQVSDRGIGIKEEDLQRVFEPFSAIEKPTYVKGTGLGLSITKGLIEAHGGKIWPNPKEKKKEPHSPSPSPKERRSVSVPCIEDPATLLGSLPRTYESS